LDKESRADRARRRLADLRLPALATSRYASLPSPEAAPNDPDIRISGVAFEDAALRRAKSILQMFAILPQIPHSAVNNQAGKA
jgi:hypothetical protein